MRPKVPSNEPKGTKPTQNRIKNAEMRPTLTQNDPIRAKTSKNKLKQAKTGLNYSKQPKTTQYKPKRAEITLN